MQYGVLIQIAYCPDLPRQIVGEQLEIVMHVDDKGIWRNMAEYGRSRKGGSAFVALYVSSWQQLSCVRPHPPSERESTEGQLQTQYQKSLTPWTNFLGIQFCQGLQDRDDKLLKLQLKICKGRYINKSPSWRTCNKVFVWMLLGPLLLDEGQQNLSCTTANVVCNTTKPSSTNSSFQCSNAFLRLHQDFQPSAKKPPLQNNKVLDLPSNATKTCF